MQSLITSASRNWSSPSGRPSPPPGWVAQWDPIQNSWYYVNVNTGGTQRRFPSAPRQRQSQFALDAELAARLQAEENARRPRNSGRSHSVVESDAALAARLQAEEDARASQGSQRLQQQAHYKISQATSSRPGKVTNGTSRYPLALRSAMSTGGRSKNRHPKKVRWGFPLAVEIQ